MLARKDLTEEEAEASLNLLLNNGSEALISAFLVLLRAKGETFEEVILHYCLMIIDSSIICLFVFMIWNNTAFELLQLGLKLCRLQASRER